MAWRDNPISKRIEDEAGNVKRGDVGGVIGASVGGGMVGAAQEAGKVAGGAVGMDRSKQRELGEQSGRASEDELSSRQGILNKMNQEDEEYRKRYEEQMTGYLGRSKATDTAYRDNLARNQSQAREQATNAQSTYTNDIQPRMKSSMEDAQRESAGAMSLADAGDPNSGYQKKIRGMYDEMGQGELKQGVSDFGVLSALGSQATQNTMGAGGPMTGSQLQLLGAQNQQQAGQAYSKARQRMDSLKQQGIDRGFDESSKQYNRGQGAKDRYRESTGDYEGGMDRNIGRQRVFRGEDTGYGSDIRGVEQNMAQQEMFGQNSLSALRKQNVYASSNRELSQNDAKYGNTQAQIANQVAQANAENAAKAGMAGGIIQAAGAGAGAYFGGSQGAQAGNSITSPIAQGMGGYGQQPQQQQGFQRNRRNYENYS